MRQYLGQNISIIVNKKGQILYIGNNWFWPVVSHEYEKTHQHPVSCMRCQRDSLHKLALYTSTVTVFTPKNYHQ